MARVEMRDMPVGLPADGAKARRGPLADLSVSVEALRRQTTTAQGLQLDVTIRNNGPQAVVLADPAEFVQLQLLNSRGYPVDLPPIPTGGLAPKQLGGGTGSRELAERRPFEVLKPRIEPDAKPIPSEARVEQGRLSLPAGREYRLTLQIRKILADPLGYAAEVSQRARTPADAQTPAAPPPGVIAIPPDQYTARVQIALVPPGRSDGSRQLESGPVVVSFKPSAESPPGKARQ